MKHMSSRLTDPHLTRQLTLPCAPPAFPQVLHIRNLPYETTEEELRELCAPFGPIVQTKLNVGANKNQAFVEFPETSMGIQMVSYFSNSADPAKVCTPMHAAAFTMSSMAHPTCMHACMHLCTLCTTCPCSSVYKSCCLRTSQHLELPVSI